MVERDGPADGAINYVNFHPAQQDWHGQLGKEGDICDREVRGRV